MRSPTARRACSRRVQAAHPRTSPVSNVRQAACRAAHGEPIAQVSHVTLTVGGRVAAAQGHHVRNGARVEGVAVWGSGAGAAEVAVAVGALRQVEPVAAVHVAKDRLAGTGPAATNAASTAPLRRVVEIVVVEGALVTSPALFVATAATAEVVEKEDPCRRGVHAVAKCAVRRASTAALRLQTTGHTAESLNAPRSADSRMAAGPWAPLGHRGDLSPATAAARTSSRKRSFMPLAAMTISRAHVARVRDGRTGIALGVHALVAQEHAACHGASVARVAVIAVGVVGVVHEEAPRAGARLTAAQPAITTRLSLNAEPASAAGDILRLPMTVRTARSALTPRRTAAGQPGGGRAQRSAPRSRIVHSVPTLPTSIASTTNPPAFHVSVLRRPAKMRRVGYQAATVGAGPGHGRGTVAMKRGVTGGAGAVHEVGGERAGMTGLANRVVVNDSTGSDGCATTLPRSSIARAPSLPTIATTDQAAAISSMAAPRNDERTRHRPEQNARTGAPGHTRTVPPPGSSTN